MFVFLNSMFKMDVCYVEVALEIIYRGHNLPNSH